MFMKKLVLLPLLMVTLLIGCMSDEEIRMNGIKEEAKDIYIESKVKFDVAVVGGLETEINVDSIEKELFKLIKSNPEEGLERSKEIADTLILLIANENQIEKE